MMTLATRSVEEAPKVALPSIVSQWRKFVFATDLHGDEQHKDTVSALFRFCEDWRPDIRIFGGDLWDLRALRKGASEEEKADDMAEDYEVGMEFLRSFRPDFFLRGNHDERLWDLAEGKAGPIRMFAGKCCGEIEDECGRLGMRMLPYHKRDGVLKIGGVKFLHGYAAGVNAARKHALTYGSCVFGHVHSIDHVSLERGEKTQAWSVGAMCNVDMTYNRAQIGSLRHANGFAYGVVNEKNGLFHVWQAENVGGKFLLATGIEEF